MHTHTANYENPLWGKYVLRVIMVWSTCFIVSTSAVAHTDPPGPPPPPDSVIGIRGDDTIIKPLRWSWIHWWEANRWRLLEPREQAGTRQNDAANMQLARKRAETLLIDAAASENHDLRGAAFMALGRLQTERSFSLMLKAALDEKQRVRQKGVLALGLLSADESEAALTGITPQTPLDETDRLAAFSLLQTLSAKSLDVMAKGLMLDQLGSTQTAVSVWALSQHAGGASSKILLNLIQQTKDPVVASDCLIALGKSADPRALRLLSNVLLTEDRKLDDNPELMRLPVWRALNDAYQREAIVKGKGDRTQVFGEDGKPLKNQLGGNVYTQQLEDEIYGPEQIRLARMRVSAAIGLTLMNTAEANQALLNAQFMHDTDYSSPYKSFAAVGLGENGYEPALAVLINTLKTERITPNRPAIGPDAPIRGFAALALGIYAKSLNTDQGLADRLGTLEALSALGEVFVNPKENLEIRSACAVGMALSGRTANLRPLGAVPMDSKRQPLLSGYAFFARGALGDQGLIARTLTVLNDWPESDTERVLAARALVLGVGMLGSREGLPVLQQAWHNGYFTSREVIHAIRLMNVSSAGLAICDLFEGSDSFSEKVYFCELLGELLGKGQPSPLDRFVANTNFVFRMDARRDYQSMGNPLLFDYLIPDLGESKWIK